MRLHDNAKTVFAFLSVFAMALASANDNVCVNKNPNKSELRIIETYSSARETLRDVKASDPEQYRRAINVATADINADGQDELFYALGHPLSGNCGLDIGVLTKSKGNAWTEVLLVDCASECFAMQAVASKGYRSIVNLDETTGTAIKSCAFNAKKRKYVCKSVDGH
jgi:hypothetical protein